MFHKILVPLDGSGASQFALEPAFRLAQKYAAEVILLRVVVLEEVALQLQTLSSAYFALRDEMETRLREEAQTYLKAIRAEWKGMGVPIRTEVGSGAPPQVIHQIAAERSVDLIVMSTHGRAGLGRFVYGSVAEAVLRGSPIPVLLVPVKQ